MVCKVLSAAPLGYEAEIIEVEVDHSKGIPGLQIVGMGNKELTPGFSCKENNYKSGSSRNTKRWNFI